jgi:hypothetical protein
LFAHAHILGIFVAKQPIFRFSAVFGGGFRQKHQQRLKKPNCFT